MYQEINSNTVLLLDFAFILSFIVKVCYLLTLRLPFLLLENKIFIISTQYEAFILHYNDS